MSRRYNNNFPVLRKSSSLAKPVISLAKVEIDSSGRNADSGNSKMQNREVVSSFSHKRIGSGISIRQLTTQSFTKTSRSQFYDHHKRISNLIHQSTSNMTPTQQIKDGERPPPCPNIDKAKISTKFIGEVKGYAVNSHPGPLNSVNEDRICIVTNLTRSSSKEAQVSFFSIYDGR